MSCEAAEADVIRYHQLMYQKPDRLTDECYTISISMEMVEDLSALKRPCSGK